MRPLPNLNQRGSSDKVGDCLRAPSSRDLSFFHEHAVPEGFTCLVGLVFTREPTEMQVQQVSWSLFSKTRMGMGIIAQAYTWQHGPW